VLFYFWSGAQNRFLSNSTVSLNRWNNIVFTKNASDLRIYINGSLDNSTTLGVTPQSSNTLPLVIGGAANGRFNGRISQVQIYDRALSAEDILYNYNVTRSRFDVVKEGLVMHLDAGNSASYPGNGTAWTDLTGSGNNGTLTNGPTFDSSNGGSLVFDGSNDYVLCPKINALANTSQFTLCAWVKRHASNSMVIVGQIQGLANDVTFELWNDGNAYFEVGNGSNSYGSVSNNSTNWQYMAMSYDGTQSGNTSRLRAYINGVLQTLTFTSTIPATTGTVDVNLNVGAFLGNSNYSRGNISQVKVYNRALTAQEIQQNYNAARGRYGL
jgi:hypothetical protein